MSGNGNDGEEISEEYLAAPNTHRRLSRYDVHKEREATTAPRSSKAPPRLIPFPNSRTASHVRSVHLEAPVVILASLAELREVGVRVS